MKIRGRPFLETEKYYDLDARKELTNKLFLTAQFRMISQKPFCCLSVFMRKTPVHHVLMDAFFPLSFMLGLCILYWTTTQIELDEVISSAPLKPELHDFIVGSIPKVFWSRLFPVNKIFHYRGSLKGSLLIILEHGQIPVSSSLHKAGSCYFIWVVSGISCCFELERNLHLRALLAFPALAPIIWN